MKKRIISIFILLTAAFVWIRILRAQETTQPSGPGTTSLASEVPATQPAPAVVSPDARKLLDQVRDAYASAKSVSIVGTITGHFDVDGQKSDATGQFTGLFSGGKFRHEMKDDATIGSTGQDVFIFLPSSNKYLMQETNGRAYLDTIDANIADALRKQDLSMALLLSHDASAELLQGTATAALADAVKIDGVEYPAIALGQEMLDIVLSVDPQTHLIRRETVDLTKQAKARGAHDVKSAMYQIDFTNTPNATFAADAFAWSPPPGSQSLSSSPLDGKTVPSFSATGLDGTVYSSDNLKGSVYVLDFWASWCGPCIASLPHLDEIYQQMKDSGVKIIAINEQDPKETAQKSVTDLKLTLPVALDSDGSIYASFGFDSLPTTVVVGKDGNIRRVFIGAGNEAEIQQELQAAVKGN